MAAGLKVEQVQFKGNHSIKSSQLREILKTQKGKPFDNKLLRLDRILLRNFYITRGFLDVWVETEIDRKGNKITITYEIAEGKQYFLGEIKLIGCQLISPDILRKSFPIENGEIFQRQKIEEGLNKIERFYFDNGKPFVQIREEQSTRDSLIIITVHIQEGETVYINEIQYQGLKLGKAFIIRRELGIREGDRYSRKKIEESQRNIYSTGLFDYVGMDIQPLDSARRKVRLVIKVVEKKPRWVGARFGVAYEQETVYGGTFDFTLEFGHRNLFGTARSLSFRVIPSISYDFTEKEIINPKNQYSLTYVEPWIGYTRTPGVFNASFYQVRPVNSADYNYLTTSFQVRHEFDNYWKISGTVAFDRVSILEADTLSREFFTLTKGQDFIYSIGSTLIRDKRDNYLNPQEGSVLQTSLKFAYSRSRDDQTGTISLNRFIKWGIQWNRYQKFPLIRNWIFATRIRSGNIFELGERTVIPLVERYFLGGASTVRGYPEQLLGPIVYTSQQKPQAIGGKLLVLGNLELRFPIFWLFWGEIFTDFGNVWLQHEYFKIADIKSSSGAGVAIVTPIGPVRFDYGIKHRPEADEDPGEFHISISFAF
ncbi:MAG: hypothetical protein Kow0042_20480 [Calditrichia bacterium]